ncbi:MAG: nitroreductase family protein [Bacteroidales bacterium]|nr:nitroreductase family protein [Bacteroidales bacterium]
MSQKKSFFQKLSDLTHIHHRAAFTDVHKRTSPKSDFLKLAENRYSCRAFTTRKLLQTEINQILEACRVAPTATNKQPVHVWTVKSEEALAKLKEATPYTFDAPTVFMVGCNKEEAWVRKYDGHNEAEIDAAIVGSHLMLEAADLGLGTTWVGSFDPAKIKELFPETAGWQIVALFPAGHPAMEPSPRHAQRKPMEEFTSEL